MSGEVTISSTTDDQPAVEAALHHDEAVGYQETPPNDKRSHVILTSKTDESISVDEANRMYPDQPDAADGAWAQQATEKPLPVQSTIDPEEVVREESAKLREHQETTGIDYATGRPRSAEKRIAKLVKEREEFRARSEALEAQLQAQYGQPQPQQQQQPTPQEH